MSDRSNGSSVDASSLLEDADQSRWIKEGFVWEFTLASEVTRNQFLRAYDVSGDADRGTNLGAIINALEFKRAHPHLSSNEDLADYLNDYPTAADELGFDLNDISEDVFAYARRERLEPWVESMIEQQAEWAAERVADQRYNDGYDEYYEELFPDEGPSIAQVLAATDRFSIRSPTISKMSEIQTSSRTTFGRFWN